MHAKCSNCQSNLTCGCQKRVASNGVSCCTMCLTAYENSIKAVPQTTVQRLYVKQNNSK
jgi:hypothetical protein